MSAPEVVALLRDLVIIGAVLALLLAGIGRGRARVRQRRGDGSADS